MPRPETTDEVTNRDYQVATFQLSEFATDPEMVKRYAAFIDLVKMRGGTVEGSTHVTASMPRDAEQLAVQLRSDQSTWDTTQRWYEQAERGETVPDYAWYSLKLHAEREGLPVLTKPVAVPADA